MIQANDTVSGKNQKKNAPPSKYINPHIPTLTQPWKKTKQKNNKTQHQTTNQNKKPTNQKNPQNSNQKETQNQNNKTPNKTNNHSWEKTTADLTFWNIKINRKT